MPTFTRECSRAQAFPCPDEAEWARRRIPHRIGRGQVLATWVGWRHTPDGLARIVVAEVVLPTGRVVKVYRAD